MYRKAKLATYRCKWEWKKPRQKDTQSTTWAQQVRQDPLLKHTQAHPTGHYSDASVTMESHINAVVSWCIYKLCLHHAEVY